MELLIGGADTATALQSMGLPIDAASEAWKLLHPNRVARVSRATFEAGADFVLTNTFGANRARLEAAGVAGGLEELNLQAVALAREGASDEGRVYGSIGPTGMLEELGEKKVREIDAEQVGALVSSGVDGYAIETAMSATEAVLALSSAR